MARQRAKDIKTRVPKLFIGSSAEALPVARAVFLQFEHDRALFEAHVWNTCFKLNRTPIESLETILREYEYAVFVLTPEDEVTIRGKKFLAVRDNVLLELGFFIGHVGRFRTFGVKPRDSIVSSHLPTDLSSITWAEYNVPAKNADLSNALTGAAERIRTEIAEDVEHRRNLARKRVTGLAGQIKGAIHQCRTDEERVRILCNNLQGLISGQAEARGQTVTGVLHDLLIQIEAVRDILDPRQLAEEQTDNLKKVWVFASEPLESIKDNGEFRRRVFANLRSGVEYVYFADGPSRVDNMIAMLEEMIRQNDRTRADVKKTVARRVQIVELQPSCFMTYYTVHHERDGTTKVMQSAIRDNRKDLLEELEGRHAKRVVAQIQGILELCQKSEHKGWTVWKLSKCPICKSSIS